MALLHSTRYQQSLRRYHARGSGPETSRWRPGASAAARRPREAQAHAPLGGVVRHRQSSEARNVKLANSQGEVYSNAWNIQQLRRFYP